MKKLIIIIAAIFLVGVIGGGFAASKIFKGHKGKAADSAKAKADSSAESIKEAEASAPKAHVELDEFLVNLADPQDQHFLKCTVVLEVKGGEEAAKKMEEQKPVIKDAIITAMSRKTFAELLTPNGKRMLKNTIRSEVNLALKTKDVTEVLFTAFAMQ